MKLEKYRKFDFAETTLNTPHPFAKYKKITFLGTDNSKIELDLVIPNSKVKGVIVDFPEFKVKNKDFLNNTPCSHFPFIDSEYEIPYYNLVFQDALDTIHITEMMFPNKDIIATGLGQGAAISLVCAKYFDSVTELFIEDCSLCDIKNTYIQNKKDPIFKKLYNFEIDLPEKTDYLYDILDSIDILNISSSITQKVHYAMSYLSPKTPLEAQLKLVESLKNVTVQHYKFLDYKKIFQHQFDDYILETLSTK